MAEFCKTELGSSWEGIRTISIGSSSNDCKLISIAFTCIHNVFDLQLCMYTVCTLIPFIFFQIPLFEQYCEVYLSLSQLITYQGQGHTDS